MMRIKIEGITDFANMMHEGALVDAGDIEKAVSESSMPLVEKVKSGYARAGHQVTGKLINSIESFKRARKHGDFWFTNFIGPRYGRGGNAAHLLEYGTVERFIPNRSKGGVGKKEGLSRNYGAEKSVGAVKPFGVLRKAADEYRSTGQNAMATKIMDLITKKAKQKGLEVK
jgi:hypothetical protein